GWMHRGYVTRPPAVAVDHRISLGCVTTTSAGMRRAMPLGAWLTPGEEVRSGDVIIATERMQQFPPDAAAITRSAQLYFEGTSYLWGGVTPWGADCSGIVQSVFWLHGIQLKRDAWMQAQEGALADADPRNARAADLLFFSD